MKPGVFQKRTFEVCKKIPKGRVSTYGVLALVLGKPRASRAVGNALNKNRLKDVPCHRVVRADGFVGGFRGGTQKKIEKLKDEGVVIKSEKIDLGKFGYFF